MTDVLMKILVFGGCAFWGIVVLMLVIWVASLFQKHLWVAPTPEPCLRLVFSTLDPSPSPGLTFGEVELDQFFLSMSGCLCQKVEEHTANTVADSSGYPSALQIGMRPEDHVQCAYPAVSKIKVEL